MRIGFFGTPSLARSVLSNLISDSRIEIAFVVTNPDAPVGRKGILTPTPVKDLATTRGIPVFTPTKIRNNTELHETLRSYQCDYFVVVAYGRILPNIILDMPAKLSVNIHGSLLPKYRGASPIQSALLHGEKETGVTIMCMSEGMDEGDILSTAVIPLDARETSGTLIEKFATISGKTLIETLFAYENGQITPIPQDHTNATYCQKIQKEDGKIDFSKTAKEIYHMWQAYTPWPGIYTFYEGKRLILEEVSYTTENKEYAPGTPYMSEGSLYISCREGALMIHTLKPEGKKSQTVREFLSGHAQFLKTVL